MSINYYKAIITSVLTSRVICVHNTNVWPPHRLSESQRHSLHWLSDERGAERFQTLDRRWTCQVWGESDQAHQSAQTFTSVTHFVCHQNKYIKWQDFMMAICHFSHIEKNTDWLIDWLIDWWTGRWVLALAIKATAQL